jgi:FKBP12-rapamycin complex-associated protein
LEIEFGTNKEPKLELLDIMFSHGLNEPLRQCLIEITKHLPSFLPIIQDRLLNIICIILSR